MTGRLARSVFLIRTKSTFDALGPSPRFLLIPSNHSIWAIKRKNGKMSAQVGNKCPEGKFYSRFSARKTIHLHILSKRSRF